MPLAMSQNSMPCTIENNILKGSEHVYVSDERTSVGQFVLTRLQSDPDFVGQIDCVTGRRDTYGEMRDRSIRCALWMQKQGIGPGDVITICSSNHLDLAMPCFATLYLGAAFSPLDAGMNAKDVSHMMSITKPKMAFADQLTAFVVAEAAKRAKLDVSIVVFGKLSGFVGFDEILAESTIKNVESFECFTIENLETTAFVMSSSGTTGLPKGIAVTHRSSIRQFHTWARYWRNERICLVYSTIYWITGTFAMFFSLYCNMIRLVAPPFEEHRACSIIEKYKVDWLLLNTSMCNRLLKYGVLEVYDLSSVKRIVCGGACMSAKSHTALRHSLRNAVISLIYGMTEASGFITAPCPDPKPGSCGYLLDNGQMKVVDPDTGRTLRPNEHGELYIRLPTLMKHYYNNPKATAETVDTEGWLRTGDLGYFDEDGEIFIVARLKELIKYQNYQIPPREIEAVILSHPGVKDAAVVGLPHPQEDEHPMAFVIKSEGSRVTENELIDLVATELSDVKRLRGGVRFVDKLPRTATDKLKLGELRELAKMVAKENVNDNDG